MHEIANEVYSPEQCQAWASHEINHDHWQRRCAFKRPFVSMRNDQIAGFLELDTDGHIDCAYVNPDFKRQGVMTELVQYAINICRGVKLKQMRVEASICAKPLFEKVGFQLVTEQLVHIRDAELINFQMQFLLPVARDSGAERNRPGFASPAELPLE